MLRLEEGLITSLNKMIASSVVIKQPADATTVERAHVAHLRDWLETPVCGGVDCAAAGGGAVDGPLEGGGGGAPVDHGGHQGGHGSAAPPVGRNGAAAGDGGGAPTRGGGGIDPAVGGGGSPRAQVHGGGAGLAAGLPTSPTSPLGGLLDCEKRTPANNRKGLLFFTLVIFADPAVEAFKPRQCAAVRHLAVETSDTTRVIDVRVLKRASNQWPKEESFLPDGVDPSVLVLLCELRMLQTFLTAVEFLGADALPECHATAACLLDISNCVEAYHATCNKAPAVLGSAAAFGSGWAGDGRS